MFSRKSTIVQHAEGLTRRDALKFFAAVSIFSGTLLSRPLSLHAAAEGKKVLIIYFSHTNNTRTLAQQIHGFVGGDMLELKTVHTYPSDHKAIVNMAVEERRSNIRPKLSTVFPATMDAYDVVFAGYPVWEYTMPMAFFSFFDQYKFVGKTIVPFSTHLGSGLGHGPEDIAKLCPQAKILKGFAVRGPRVANAQNEVNQWLQSLGFASN